MFNQGNYGGGGYPNQFQGGYYDASGQYYSKGATYFDNQPQDRYYAYGQQQGGYQYGSRGYQSQECMDQCLACLAAMCCCCLVCDLLH